MKKLIYRTLVVALAAALAACAANSLHREGLADVDRGEYESGVQKLSEAVAKDPDNLSFKLDLAARRNAAVQKLISTGDSERSSAQLDQATATYRRVLAIEPEAIQGARAALDGRFEPAVAGRRHVVRALGRSVVDFHLDVLA